MKTVIDLVLIGILVICTWGGFKKGLIMGVGGILCIVVSLYGANLLANTFSYDVVPALEPFAGGYTEGIIANEDSEVRERMGWEDYSYSVEDLLARYPERKTEFGAVCFETLGIDAGTAAVLAERAVAYAEESGESMKDSVVHILCETVSYVGCFALAFLIIIIVLTVIGNLPNLSYKIPRLDLVNDIGGTLLGVVTGVLFCMLLVWALKFLGMIIGDDTLTATKLGKLFLEHNIYPKHLGI